MEIVLNNISNQIIGNKCGHNPLMPRIFNATRTHKQRPFILEDAKKKLLEYYFDPKDYLKNIKFSRNSTKQQRSEAREAIVLVVQTMLHYLHLPTMQVGVKEKDSEEFRHFSNQFIYEKAGIDRRRFARALHSLSMAGYVKVTKRFKFGKDKIVENLTSIKKISESLFFDLKLSNLKIERAKAYISKIKNEGFKNVVYNQQILEKIQKIFKGSRLAREEAKKNKTKKIIALDDETFNKMVEHRQKIVDKYLFYFPDATEAEILKKHPEIVRK